MFIRQVKNRSGSISVQVAVKESGTCKIVKSFGSSKDKDKIDYLIRLAEEFIHNPNPNQKSIFPQPSDRDEVITDFFSNNNWGVKTIGPELIIGTLFDQIGLNVVPEKLFRHLVISRLVFPLSKLKTVDYLYRYQGTETSVSSIYRFLDRLDKKYDDLIKQTVYNHTKKLLVNLSVVFYDFNHFVL